MSFSNDTQNQGRRLELIGFCGVPEVIKGDDLASIITTAAKDNGIEFEDGDVLAIAQKIISKSEGRLVLLDKVTPSDEAKELAVACDKDPRLVELILSESKQIVRMRPGLVITEHRIGFVNASAGIDMSNVGPGYSDSAALLLPLDPDESARKLREGLYRSTGARVGVIITDTMGRAWRRGVVGQAIGSAGVRVIWDRVGDTDRNGRLLTSTEVAVLDELAAAASFLMGQGDEGRPVILIRGSGECVDGEDMCKSIVRSHEDDLFR